MLARAQAPAASRWKIRSYVGVLAAMSIVQLTTLLALWWYTGSRDDAHYEEAFKRIASVAALDARRELREAEQMLASFSREADVRLSLAEGRCLADLRAQLHRTPRYANLVVLDKDERVLCSGLPARAGLRLRVKADTQALASNAPALDEPHEGPLSKRRVVGMAYPVRAGDEPVGVVGLSINLEQLAPVLPELGLPARMLAGIVTARGARIASSGGAEQPEAERVAAWIRSAVPLSAYAVRSGADDTWTYALAPIKGTDWVAIAGLPTAEIRAERRAEAWTGGVLLLGVSFLSLVVAALVRGRISRPVEAIAGAMRAAVHDRSVRVPVNGPREIADIASEFNRLQESLASEMRELRRTEARVRLLHRAIEHAPLSVLIFDRHGTVDYASAYFCLTSGYRAEEVLGRNVRDLTAAITGADEYREIASTVLAGKAWHGQLRSATKGGETYWEAAAILPVLDEQQRLINVLAIKENITAQKHMESALAESRRNLSMLFDASPDGLLFARSGADPTVVHANDAFLALTGLSRAELGDARLSSLLPLVDPAHHRAVWARIREGETVRDVEIDFFRPDGGKIPLALSVRSLQHGDERYLLIAARDVSERRRAFDELKASEARWQFAIEGHGDGLWDWNVERGNVFASARCRQILQLEDVADEDLLAVWHARIHADDVPAIDEAVRACTEDGAKHMTGEYRYRCADDRTIWIAVRGMVLKGEANGSGLHLISTVRDITEKKLREQSEHKRQEDLVHAGRIAVLGEMASTLSHELNQPLTAIGAYAATGTRLLRAASAQTDKLAEVLSEINAQAQRAGEIVWRVRDFVRKRPTQCGNVDLAEVVRNVVHLMGIEARMREATIDIALEPSLPAVFADRIQLEQVLINLVKNALEAMAGCSGERRVLITAQRADTATVRLAVRDTGPGLSDAVMERLFEPFFTTRADGTGMGLGISRSIVESHGGRLWAERAEGGAQFIFVLPVQQRQIHDH